MITQDQGYGDQIGLFSEDIAVFGHVPYVFYMPNITKSQIEFINNNGGEISHLVECFTVQLFYPKNLENGNPGIS